MIPVWESTRILLLKTNLNEAVKVKPYAKLSEMENLQNKEKTTTAEPVFLCMCFFLLFCFFVVVSLPPDHEG